MSQSKDLFHERDADVDYLHPGHFIDSDDPAVVEFAQKSALGLTDETDKAVALYLAVRDEVIYDPYYVGRDAKYYRASDCLNAGRGFCIPKAALMAAGARALNIPARVGYADVRNHLSTEKLDKLVGSNSYRWHSYCELYLEHKWVKATPAFNRSLCERFGVHTLEFDGRTDSLLQEFDQSGRQHMEYIAQRGHFVDVPFQDIVADFVRYHLDWLDYRSNIAQKEAIESWD